ncbi:MAG: hypothetical protein OCD01_14070 [Fibrobacterales bacterium]
MIGHTKLCAFLGAIAVIASTAISAPDEMDVENVSKTDTSTTQSLAWFKLGDMRLVNNDWGTQDPATNCSFSEYSIFVEKSGSFGWTFDRWGCGAGGSKPDYPEIEFGIHPFGTSKHLVTTPDYSSTDILPKQLSEIESFVVDIDNYRIDIENGGSWNLNVEMWFTEEHPVTGNHTTAHSELMLFFGWHNGRYGWDGPVGNVNISGNNYDLIVNKQQWPPGQGEQWKYFQFRQQGGPHYGYSGELDIKQAIEWLKNAQGFSDNLWLARVELGTEIDDGTKGKVTIDNITWKLNDDTRGVEFFDPTQVVEPSSSSAIAPSSSSEEPSSSSAIESSSEIESSSSSQEEESSEAIESSEEFIEESSEETSALFNKSKSSYGTSLMYRVSPSQSTTTIKVKEDGRYSVSLFDALGNLVTQFEAQSESKSIMLHSSKDTAEGLYIMKAVKIQ